MQNSVQNSQPTTNARATSRFNIFSFGDSLSDTGNSLGETAGLIPPSPPYFEGRFSNGPVAVELVAEQLGLGIDQSTNFAVGGATTGRTNVNSTPFFKLGGLLDQLDRFQAQATSLDAGPEDLYWLWVGANDLFNAAADLAGTIQTAVGNIATAVTTLAQAGAKTIVVAKTPNLGRTPLALAAGLSPQLIAASTAFNTALETALTALETRLNPVNLILTDLFSVSETIAQDPANFGFTNVTTPFLQTLIPTTPAADPNSFFFWDVVHPTTKSHSIYAEVFRQSVISSVDPVNRVGTAAADRLVGYSGNDQLRGRGGPDRLEGNPGHDLLWGNQGNDTILGGEGDDQLYGGFSNDQVQGGAGADRLSGSRGRDQLIGGEGDDLLVGGRGRNQLQGDGGADTFVLNLGGLAIVRDFQNNLDRLRLPNVIRFEQLQISQRGRDTHIQLAETNERLASLRGIAASAIGAADFV